MDDVLHIGDSAEFTKTLTQTDLSFFIAICGDFNPYHVDDVWSGSGRFGGTVVQGMLTSSLICGVLGMRLPGPGTIHLAQKLDFVAPVRPGDTITARVQVIELLEKGRMRLRTQCRNHEGSIVVDGEALVIAPRERCAGGVAGRSPPE